MKINAIICLNCHDVIFSRARHDFRTCSCGNISVDGGFDYMKISQQENAKFQQIKIEVDATKNELYNDWGSGKDKFGLIKGKI